MSIYRWMDKDVVYVCNGIWLSHKKELNLAIFNMDKPKGHYAKWNKSDRERQVLYDHTKWRSLSCVWLFETPWTIQSLEFFRPEYWSGLRFPPPGDLPNVGIKSRSPALQANSLPAEPQRKPKNTGWVAYPFSRGSSWPRNRTGVSCITGRFFTNWGVHTCGI